MSNTPNPGASVPDTEQFRRALAQLIIEKDAINSAMTNLLHSLDNGVSALSEMFKEAESDTDDTSTDS